MISIDFHTLDNICKSHQMIQLMLLIANLEIIIKIMRINKSFYALAPKTVEEVIIFLLMQLRADFNVRLPYLMLLWKISLGYGVTQLNGQMVRFL